MATVDAMKVANKEMKKQYKGIDIDKIEVSSATRVVVYELIRRVSTTTWRT